MYLFTMRYQHRFTVYGVDMPKQTFFNKKTGEPLFSVDGGICYIHPGYSWDGCSPRFKLFGRSWGTSNGPKVSQPNDEAQRNLMLPQLYFPSAEHDCFCQFQPEGITRKKVDRNFYLSMVAMKWKYAKAYYKAVRAWSKISRKG